MEGLDIRKLYGSHENEIFTIERAFGKKTQVIDFFFWTSTQQSIHVFTPMGRELVFPVARLLHIMGCQGHKGQCIQL